MKIGISTSSSTAQSAPCLKSSGIDFVVRYYSTTTSKPQKRITRSEADAIFAAGLALTVIYEDGPTDVAYFSQQRGSQDATNAFNAAISLGQPSGSAIYFAVDYDAPQGEISGPIFSYFTGIAQGMQQAASASGLGLFSIGVYGSGDVCAFIKGQNQLAQYSWLAESQGWGGSRTYADWNINQAIPTSDVCGFTADPQTYDENRATDDFGGFTSTVNSDRFLSRSIVTGNITSAKTSASDLLATVLNQLDRSLGQGHPVLFPNGIELIRITIKNGPSEIELQITGNNASNR